MPRQGLLKCGYLCQAEGFHTEVRMLASDSAGILPRKYLQVSESRQDSLESVSAAAVPDPVLCGHGWWAVLVLPSRWMMSEIRGLGVLFLRNQTVFPLHISLDLRHQFFREIPDDFRCSVTSQLRNNRKLF